LKPRRSNRPPSHQPTPQALIDELSRFLESKFYPGHPVPFQKDRPRLLKWVVFPLAKYLDDKAVTIPPARYLEIVKGVLMEALQLGDTGRITYLPAWLGKVMQSHLDHHGEEYYEEAKVTRNYITTVMAGIRPGPARDAVRELAQAARLLKPKKAPKRPINAQLNLL
jgi:hypothetical protein